ncbi:MAG: hypothetical protein AAGD43_07140 [Pseudomonadota bacterium]
MSLAFDEARVRAALKKSWSSQTAIQWTNENPASGQCNVTAAVIFDLFGGEILRTQLPGVWHYYNRINGVRLDLTDSQFSAPGALFDAPERYDDEVSDKASAMTNIPAAEYDTLLSALQRELAATSNGPQ